jgi:probable rRNA maturation factor
MSVLSLRNRQRTRSIDLHLLRKITRLCLKDIFTQPHYELGIHLIGAEEMAEVNQRFLQHSGSTDVITFDYAETKNILHGEIFISVDDAVSQAKEFRTTWQSELIRYVVHGILHLRGFDDLNPVARKIMKREENRVVTELTRRFPLNKLLRSPKK